MSQEIEALLARVTDPALRADLRRQFDQLRAKRSFGLVFEHHLPERVRLPSHPVRRGSRVVRRDGDTDEPWTVQDVTAGTATLVRDGEESVTLPRNHLVVVAEFGEPIYPGLRHLGSVDRGSDKPAHVVIKGENHHALEMLRFTHAGKVDCIYIDPPYNTGARDWKYDNDYVDADDQYRHSKWLAFMERRLKLAKELLNPDDSVLIVTIDEKEYLRLGLLLEQVFAGARIQMVSITISPRGTSRATEFSRVDEYAFFVFLGVAAVGGHLRSGQDQEVRWQYLRRTQKSLVRGSRPNQFYPIYVDPLTKRIVEVGEPMGVDESLDDVPEVPGAVPVFPIDPSGLQLIWGLTPPSLRAAVEGGYVRVTDGNEFQPFTIAHLSTANIARLEREDGLRVTGTREDGSKVVVVSGGKAARPTTVWREARHDAGAYGTSLVRSLLGDRTFPFPKSLYAVEDTLRAVVGDKPDAVVLDFFAGSGTTAHAVARLNRQDGGRRRSILVTNNEVSDAEAKSLREPGHLPGDPEWEALGIFEHITRPRITAAITGRTPDGEPVKGDYKFTDEFPMADGFEENVEFFELTYQDGERVELALAFRAIASLLWMRAGSAGRMVTDDHADAGRPLPFAFGDTYGVLFDPDCWRAFVDELPDDARIAFVVTDSSTTFAAVAAELPAGVEAVRLYRNYLSTFEINRIGGS